MRASKVEVVHTDVERFRLNTWFHLPVLYSYLTLGTILYSGSKMVADKHPATTAELLDALRTLRENNSKAVRPTVHLYPQSIYAPEEQDHASSSSSTPRRITSWKMTEHMYFQSNNNFPTLARGLFTEEVDGEERIVARGYDKFFNTDEVAWSYVSKLVS